MTGMANQETIEARYSGADITAAQLDHEDWAHSLPVAISHYWSGDLAPATRHAEARIIWTPEALNVRFDCRQNEPLIVNPHPQTEEKTMGLWDRDVGELFVAPDTTALNQYFEFEAAPTGEWIDLAISAKPDWRDTDWQFHSGMSSAARVGTDHVVIAMRIPWSEQIPKPMRGDEWRINLCRCVGSGEDRGYLAWRPTRTEKPNFHVPAVFGRLRFG
jgi:alpha-galactosidase